MSPELIQYQNANQSYDEVIKNFIVRQKEFQRVIDDILTTKDGSSFQHYVFVGRRGSGKSTLLRRIQAEISTNDNLNHKYIAVNLGEEQSGIYRLYDLWDYVIRDLNSVGYNIPKIDFRLFKDDMKAYTKALHQQVISSLQTQKKKLILLVDNIDRVLDNRGSQEDAALLRELLMNFKDIRIIGSSTVMSEHFWRYDMPFYEFFSIKRIEALTLDEVKKLMIHWSNVKNLPEIENLITKYPGKIQSIRMLTDGMPRTMLLFVDMLINRPEQNGYNYLQLIVDRATPIYQERLSQLSPAQNKVLTELAFVWDAASVEELIPKCNMDGKTISALLNQLSQSRHVEKIKGNTKNLLYRLEERFFNLWFNMTQGGPQQRIEAKALTDFLEKWYNDSELKNICADFVGSVKNGSLKRDYAESMTLALLHSEKINDQEKENLYKTISKSGLVDINVLGEPSKYYGKKEDELKKISDEKDYKKIIELLPISDKEKGVKYFGIGYLYYFLNDFYNAEKYSLLAIEKGNKDSLFFLANLYKKQGKEKEAKQYYLLAIEKEDIGALVNLANLYKEQGKGKEAEQYYLLAIEKGDLDALFNLANLYKEQGKEKEAEQYYLLAIEKEDIGALVNLALLYQKQGKEKEAELYYLLAIKKENIYALNNLALLYEKQGKEKDAEKYFILALEKGNIDAFYNLTLKYYQQNNKQKLRNLIERLQEKDLNLFKEKYSQFLSFIFLYLGEMDDFKKISDRFLVQTETLVSSMFLNSLLIHKQTNWVINYFKLFKSSNFAFIVGFPCVSFLIVKSSAF
jgi:TPR repeat protein